MSSDRHRLHQALDPERELLIRLAGPDDHVVLERLAALDSQAPLDGDALIAEVDGDPVAALSLGSGRLVADPFVHTAAVCDLLRFRAASIAASRSEASSLKRLLRLIPAAARPLQPRRQLGDLNATRP